MTEKQSPPEVEFAELLEAQPPGTHIRCPNLAEVNEHRVAFLHLPELQLHCGSSGCGGLRFFACKSSRENVHEWWTKKFLEYTCRNCGKTTKIFAVLFKGDGSGTSGEVYKVGEQPAFGPPVPARVISLIGP